MPTTQAQPALVADGTERPVIVARDLCKTYESRTGNIEGLRNVSLEIPRGKFTSVMGLSGSGKSTLVHLLSGLDSPTSGHVWVEGREITSMRDSELSKLRSERIGFVFQSFNLMPNLNVRQNLELPMGIWGRTANEAWLDRVIALVGLGSMLDQSAATLSGGQRQRVAIARALASQPSVIVADEPTGNLDLVNREVVLELFRFLADNGHTILMVTHDPEAASYSDRLLLLKQGEVAAEENNPTKELIRSLLTEGEQR